MTFEIPKDIEVLTIDITEVKKQIKKEVIDNVIEYIKLHRRYADKTSEDYINYQDMYEWLKEQKGE